ncbi:MAG: hypothetical protein IJ243_09385 [Prevotella sp.]|nr:hypothetical protein [Prevotella sp.]
MKKEILMIAALFMTLHAQAKDYVIVIRGDNAGQSPRTEVYSKDHPQTDTLSVVPASNVTSIYVTIKDVEGNTIESHYSPAQCNDHFSIITPVLPNGYILEVSDERGVVFARYEN